MIRSEPSGIQLVGTLRTGFHLPVAPALGDSPAAATLGLPQPRQGQKKPGGVLAQGWLVPGVLTVHLGRSG